ncbi:type I-F CRISPR-associated endoribonuclease Cas6/Csy4 [Thiobaca trueperi]|uniref:CRISPR-associated Csy4 family protein n=1 Tax=Thiobaca trueperi TaxID=127458 RepID=A0A4R3MQ89_9GAMM|nr:type I-F CRISPR-associated endoribonuclease Cas6/Csy4 [Thiobaca trueperi]TCT18043.1 CRISPR-associated Csy4 family protein [Thiobaca trueperi]
MRPQVFFDIESLSARRDRLQRASGQTLRELHGLFAETPACYALALPDYPHNAFGRLRVFATTAPELERLAYRLRNHALRIGDIRLVPEDFSGAWRCYRRYRIPTRAQERHADGTLRVRRIREADEARLPYFDMQSASTQQVFRLYVQRLDSEPTPGDCLPDNYGLSVSTRCFALPDVS